MTIDPRLLELLVCPLCKAPLKLARGDGGRPIELHCPADRLAFPIRDGIPLMLEGEARALDAEAPAPPAWPFTAASAEPSAAASPPTPSPPSASSPPPPAPSPPTSPAPPPDAAGG